MKNLCISFINFKQTINNMLIPVKQYVKLAIFQTEWRNLNKHNGTVANTCFPISKVSVGKGTYGSLNILHFQNDAECLQIGNYCSIAGEVVFILGGEHNYHRLSTYPFSLKIYHVDAGEKTPTKGKIIVEDDVWIGHGATILSGVTLGQGCIIATGSVVSKDVPPYAIYVGDKVLKYRFSSQTIELLSEIDFCNISQKTLEKFKAFCLTEINDDNAFEIVSLFKGN